MDLTHIHLLLNHFPTIGFIVGLGLFVLALVGKSEEMKRASLVIFLGIALMTIMVYVSGNAAGTAIESLPGVSKSLIRAHENAALQGFALMELLGGFAWVGLWQARRTSRVPAWNTITILVLSILTFGVMTQASNMGGEIRHPEIRDAESTAVAAAPPVETFARRLGTYVVNEPYVWPTCETLHFIGLSLLCGIALMVDLRILGMMKSVPFSALHRILPWGILGFGVNLVTGFLFFVADPTQYTGGAIFAWKMLFIMLAGLNVLYFTIFDDAWLVKAGDDAPPMAKFVAASAIALVCAVIFCGRMLPFLGASF